MNLGWPFRLRLCTPRRKGLSVLFVKRHRQAKCTLILKYTLISINAQKRSLVLTKSFSFFVQCMWHKRSVSLVFEQKAQEDLPLMYLNGHRENAYFPCFGRFALSFLLKWNRLQLVEGDTLRIFRNPNRSKSHAKIKLTAR